MWPSWEAERRRITATGATFAGSPAATGRCHAAALDSLPCNSWRAYAGNPIMTSCSGKLSRPPGDPNDLSFDAERAVAYHLQKGDVDEAAWLVFLMTHFARPEDAGWRRLRDVYGRLGAGVWDWKTVSANPAAFTSWIAANWQNVRGKFGNHRKYESLRDDADRGPERWSKVT